MTKTAVGLFESPATAETVVALSMASGFSRDEIRIIKRTDFDSKPAPDTDILKLGGVPAGHAGRYWDAVCSGRTLITVSGIAISGGNRANRAIEIMDAEGAVYLEESTIPSVTLPVHSVSAGPGFYARRGAAQMFEVS